MVSPSDDVFAELCAFFFKYFCPKYGEWQYKQHKLLWRFPCLRSRAKIGTALRINERFFCINRRNFGPFCSVLSCSLWRGAARRKFAWLVETRLYIALQHLIRFLNIFLLEDWSLLQCKKSTCHPASGRFLNRFSLQDRSLLKCEKSACCLYLIRFLNTF